MISKSKPRECYVYITLPEQTTAVTAGRFELGVDPQDVPLGRFVYARSYLERNDAVAFDPVELKLGRQVYETQAMHGLFGALRDASPDFWGRRIIERHAGVMQLDELDYLLNA